MKKNKLGVVFFLYIIIFELAVFIPQHASKLMVLILITNIIATLYNPKTGLFTMMSSFIMNNEMIALTNVLIILFLTKAIKKEEKSIPLAKLFLPLIVINSLISAISNNTIINLVFSLCYFTMIIIIAENFNKFKIEEDFLKEYVKTYIIIEFIIFITILFKNFQFLKGDTNYGTFMNAHLLGNWTAIIFLYLIGDMEYFKNTKSNALYIILCLIMLYFSDSKAIVLCLILTIIMNSIFKINKESGKNIILKIILIMFISIYLIIPIIKTNSIKEIIKTHDIETYNYLYEEQWNYKFKYFDGTIFKELNGIRFFFGFGLGQYGSRFANLFTYDISYRSENLLNTIVKKNFLPHYNENYAKYISFYKEDFVKEIWWRSAILTYPFNSFIAIIGEIGWIGLIFLAIYLQKEYGNSKYKNIFLFFLLTCLFDNYVDMFLSLGITLLFLSIKNKEKVKEENREVANDS